MQCNAVMGAVLILLLLMVLEGTSGGLQRAERRAPPRSDKPLSLEDLKFEVGVLSFVYTVKNRTCPPRT